MQNQEIAEEAVPALRNNLDTIHTVAEWARVSGYSRAHFSVLVKQYFGESPFEIIRREKFKRIKNMVRQNPGRKGRVIAGPWRLVLSDDDKDYQDFSRRQQSDFAQDIWTYDMANGTWSEVKTGFTTDRKTSGSSDDPIRESGVRRITKDNVESRLVYGMNNFTASKSYSGGSFAYSFKSFW